MHTDDRSYGYCKGKAVPQHAYGGAGGRGGIAPTDEVSGQRHASAALYPRGKDPPVPIGQEAGWAPEPVYTQTLDEKSCLPPPGIEPQSPGRPVRSQTLY
jgi:hypothetical protein